MVQTRRHFLSVAGLLGLFGAVSLAADTCYYPNGNSDSNPVNAPCASYDGQPAMCCALNRNNTSGGLASEGWTSDVCMQNGLCKNIYKLDNDNEGLVTVTEYWRDLCSSSDWPERSCLNVCSGGKRAGKTVQLTPCNGLDNSTEWCCGRKTECCGTSSAITLAAILPGLEGSSTSTSSSTPSSVSSPASTPSSSVDASPISESTGRLSTGAKAGIGVGAAAGGVLVIGAVAFLLIRNRRKANQGSIPEDTKQSPWLYRNQKPVEADTHHVYEIGAHNMRHELSGDAAPKRPI